MSSQPLAATLHVSTTAAAWWTVAAFVAGGAFVYYAYPPYIDWYRAQVARARHAAETLGKTVLVLVIVGGLFWIAVSVA